MLGEEEEDDVEAKKEEGEELDRQEREILAGLEMEEREHRKYIERRGEKFSSPRPMLKHYPSLQRLSYPYRQGKHLHDLNLLAPPSAASSSNPIAQGHHHTPSQEARSNSQTSPNNNNEPVYSHSQKQRASGKQQQQQQVAAGIPVPKKKDSAPR